MKTKPMVVSTKCIDEMAILLAKRELPRRQAIVLLCIWNFCESMLSVFPLEIVTLIAKEIYEKNDVKMLSLYSACEN